MGLSQMIYGNFHTIQHRYIQTLLAPTPSSICFWHLPISQTVGHDNGGGVLLERRNNVRTTSHLDDRYMLLDAKKTMVG